MFHKQINYECIWYKLEAILLLIRGFIVYHNTYLNSNKTEGKRYV